MDDTPKTEPWVLKPSESSGVTGKEGNSPWLNFEEVRQKLQISEKVLRRELVEGRIPATRIGQRLWRIHRDDLDRALRERAS
jgi:excisionase family DNA binding protein